MKTSSSAAVAATLALILIASAASANPPALRWRWVTNDFDTRTCLGRAHRAMQRAGHRGLDVDSSDVTGVSGDYVTRTICLRETIFVVVSGPSSSMAGRIRDAVASQM